MQVLDSKRQAYEKCALRRKVHLTTRVYGNLKDIMLAEQLKSQLKN